MMRTLGRSGSTSAAQSPRRSAAGVWGVKDGFWSDDFGSGDADRTPVVSPHMLNIVSAKWM